MAKKFFSGGQRARINLARALYSDANLYLMDDPLAAVDTKVVNHIYHNAISEELAKKTRILVTHHVSLLRNADKILCINNKARFKIFNSKFESRFTRFHSNASIDFGNPSKKIVFDGTFDEMRMSKDPYLIEMVSKEFKSDESGTDKKKKTKDGFQIDSSISLSDWLMA